MKKLSALLLVVALAACGKNEDNQASAGNPGSETHWLTFCETSSECGDGVCACGVCTLPCETNADCRELSDGAGVSCLDPEGIDDCGSTGTASSVCMATCEGDADCEHLGSDVICRTPVCGKESDSTEETGETEAPAITGETSQDSDPASSTDEDPGSEAQNTDSPGSDAGGATASTDGGNAASPPDEGPGNVEAGAAGGDDATDTSHGSDASASTKDPNTSMDSGSAAPQCDSQELQTNICEELGHTCVTDDRCCICANNPDAPSCGNYLACLVPSNNPDICPEDPPAEGDTCVAEGSAAARSCSYCLPSGPLGVTCGRIATGSDEGTWSVVGFDDWCQE